MNPVAAIHELPLHIVTETFSTIDVLKKLNCYEVFYLDMLPKSCSISRIKSVILSS